MTNKQRLEAIRSQMLTLFKQHDVAGSVVIVDPGGGVYGLHLEPTWSCAVYRGDSVHFYTLNAPPDQRKKLVTDTVHMIGGISHLGDTVAEQMETALKFLGQRFEIQMVAKSLDVRERPHTEPCPVCSCNVHGRAVVILEKLAVKNDTDGALDELRELIDLTKPNKET